MKQNKVHGKVSEMNESENEKKNVVQTLQRYNIHVYLFSLPTPRSSACYFWTRNDHCVLPDLASYTFYKDQVRFAGILVSYADA